MTEEPIPDSRSGWLWMLVMASLALLIVIWLINTWRIESDVKPGASAAGMEFPSRSGVEVAAPTRGDERAAPSE